MGAQRLMKRRKPGRPPAPSILPGGDSRKRLQKKARRGFRGHPLATLAFYGPDDRRASKVVASIFEDAEEDLSEIRKWYSEQGDVRHQAGIMDEVIAFIEEHGVLSVAMTDRIIGCPHEEGIDYDGAICPECPFWANRDRWTGEVVH